MTVEEFLTNTGTAGFTNREVRKWKQIRMVSKCLICLNKMFR